MTHSTIESLMRQIHKVWCIVCIVVMLTTMLQIQVSAESDSGSLRTVRVASFVGSYISENEHGERSGYGYDYLQNIAGYAGWKYNYVASNWEDCFSQLENGDVEIIGGISYTDERAETMLFSDLPMGEERYYIYTNDSNILPSYTDFNTLNGKNVGVLKDHIPEEVLTKWETKNGITMNHINVSSIEDVLNMMNSGKINCFVSNETSPWSDMGFSSVTYLGESNIYFVVSKNRPELKNALDAAMRRIRDDNPFYTDDLYRRYLTSQNSPFLSVEEKQWIKEHGAIRIGYLNNDIGISVVDEETGEIEGVINDYVRIARNCLHGQKLKFELKGYDSRKDQLTALHNDEIDLIFHVSQNPYSSEMNRFVLSDTVWTFNMVALTKDKSFDENAANTIAIAEDNIALKAFISYNYPNWTIDGYENTEEVIKAVKDGKADCFVCNTGLAGDYIKQRDLYSVFLTKSANVSFAIRQGEPILLSIMNKTLMSIPSEKLSGAVVTYGNSSRKVTLGDYIRDNLFIVILFVSALIALVFYIILNSLKQARASEAMAKTAADEAHKLNDELEKNKHELQDALIAAQSANVAKGTFLSNMSHDIRTPINGIIGMLSIIERSGDNPEKVSECLGKIKDSSKLLLSLISDILDMSKLESDAVIVDNDSVNLFQICRETTDAVAFQAKEAGITVSIDHDDFEGIYVWSSEIYLQKVLMNLFTNSIKYNKPNGSIFMSMKLIEKTDEIMTCEFKIRDTGIGMSEEFVNNHLFTPFVQADNSARSSYTGTGLGMPIVKQLIEKMGGTIEVESKLGEGTCFAVVIPFKLDNETNHIADDTADCSHVGISGLRILLAEDNELNMEIAEFMLSECGVKLVKAYNGKEAVKHFETSKEGEFDAILMDVMMPEMDGLTATRTIRELNHPDAKSISIIAMTANAFKEDIEKCFEAGMNAHIAKPIDMHKATRTIADCCRK